MIFIKRFSSKTIVAGLMILSLTAIVACSEEELPATAISSSQSSSITSQDSLESEGSLVSDADVVPSPTAIPGPHAIAVTPREESAAGSPEAAVLNGLERQIRAINIEDWQAFLDVCHPKFINQPRLTQIEFAFVELGGDFGYFLPGFTLKGYNARDVQVEFTTESDATTTYDVYNFDDLVAEDTERTWGAVDGVWYQNGGFMCTTDNVVKDEYKEKASN
jgi:hypothetical protein